MTDKLRKNTLMQLQVSLPKKIAITIAIMAALILLVYYCNIPNPNMILIAGLVLCSESEETSSLSLCQGEIIVNGQN